MIDHKLRSIVQAWADQDPDEQTREEAVTLLAAASRDDHEALARLRDQFGSRLQFGTAGLRGRQEAGPNRMNRVVVAQTAEGLARHLKATTGSPSIVIGYDARRNSAQYARDTAEIMAGNGIDTLLLPRPLPTPVLAFAVRDLDSSAGVMVTASHNPPSDNGYKVYLGGDDQGAQIVPPSDAAIAQSIDQAARAAIGSYTRSDAYAIASNELIDRYVADAASAHTDDDSLRYVYTAMHGVGWETAREVFTRSGFSEPIPVAEQIEPNPDFPTVAFPNPEEPGALDLAFQVAQEQNADLIIAHDPDADRLAVAAQFDSGWRRLTGNEIGVLLGWRAAKKHATRGAQDESSKTLATSLVSSPALSQIAAAYGLNYTETLTGFKWISRAPDLLFGFEEALGFLVDPELVRDKDGITAAREFLLFATELKASGSSIEKSLEEFASSFGGYASQQVSIRVEDIQLIAKIMAELRDAPPSHIGDLTVTTACDYLQGVDGLPESDILRFDLEGSARVIIRPSGTEPKLKAYIDTRSIDGDGRERLGRAAEAAQMLAEAVTELLQSQV